MRFSEYFKNSTKPIISFELFPPKTERGLQTLKNRVLPNLVRLEPSYITVTYGAGGSTQGRTLEIASAVKNDYNLESACHLTCVGGVVGVPVCALAVDNSTAAATSARHARNRADALPEQNALAHTPLGEARILSELT